MTIADMWREIDRIRPIHKTTRGYLDKFARWCKTRSITLPAQVDASICYEYLEEDYVKGKRNYKGYNNVRCAISKYFGLLAVPCGMESNPWKNIPCRKVDGVEHHRPLADAEFARLYNASPESYRPVLALGFYTGCDWSTASSMLWSAIDMDRRIISYRRPKSGTAFVCGIHDDLLAILASLPRTSGKVCAKMPSYTPFRTRIKALAHELGIKDNKEGKASFHSMRSSFFTWCDAAGLDRRTTNLAGGHKDDRQTDIYSHDISAALEICSLPSALA